MNKLENEKSLYLQQHANNPVNWYPWSQEAFNLARKNDKPVILSIGYSACHWCHVMAHESFEDIETAELMNKHFINI
ncbi:MAG: thioredoxin domain-containing protein, partial [Gammaproteobacteria bacterium]|nr:thioredoxin domain-containing protein [Gammaproteobacteria bacterium]